MNCTKCGADSLVTETRTHSYGIRRRHKCSNCNYRFTTVEIPMEEYQFYKSKIINGTNILKTAKKSLEDITYLFKQFELEEEE